MTGLLRVKNEARWIDRSIRSILPVCERVIVMDDHSTDGTPDICAAIPGVEVLRSPFEGLDETRDKNWLLVEATAIRPRPEADDWILMIDGDEMLAPASVPAVLAAQQTPSRCFSLRILYLWDSESQVRMDGIYGRFARPSMFRPDGSPFLARARGGFHCGNAPMALQRVAQWLNAKLLHFGYLYREDRLRKFEWYNHQDPGNALEDGYRHVVIGDSFPAESAFLHAGPLKLAPLSHSLT
jgi:glycosyltransferase involved in cell wall biosynthesis